MGYSCTVKADFTLEACMQIIGDKNQSNVFRGHFWEQGRENSDGAITAGVMRFLPNGIHCRRAGSIRIEADGKITRFPTMSAEERRKAEKMGLEKYHKVYPHDSIMFH